MSRRVKSSPASWQKLFFHTDISRMNYFLPVLIKLKSSRSPEEVEGNEDKSGLLMTMNERFIKDL